MTGIYILLLLYHGWHVARVEHIRTRVYRNSVLLYLWTCVGLSITQTMACFAFVMAINIVIEISIEHMYDILFLNVVVDSFFIEISEVDISAKRKFTVTQFGNNKCCDRYTRV